MSMMRGGRGRGAPGGRPGSRGGGSFGRGRGAGFRDEGPPSEVVGTYPSFYKKRIRKISQACSQIVDYYCLYLQQRSGKLCTNANRKWCAPYLTRQE